MKINADDSYEGDTKLPTIHASSLKLVLCLFLFSDPLSSFLLSKTKLHLAFNMICTLYRKKKFTSKSHQHNEHEIETIELIDWFQ